MLWLFYFFMWREILMMIILNSKKKPDEISKIIKKEWVETIVKPWVVATDTQLNAVAAYALLRVDGVRPDQAMSAPQKDMTEKELREILSKTKAELALLKE